MKQLMIIALLANLAIATTSCSPRTTCVPVAMFREVHAAVPVLPTYHSTRCFSVYSDSCLPAYLPYLTKPRTFPAYSTPPTSCCFPQ